MTLTEKEVEDIRADCFANDVTYNYDIVKHWDADKVFQFFENGGGGEGEELSSVKAADGTDPFEIPMPKEVTWQMNMAKTVAIITLNRPEAKNAMDDGIYEGLWRSCRRVLATPSLRVVFLTGSGAMFCAGGDPKTFQDTAAIMEEKRKAKAEGRPPKMEEPKKGEAFSDLLATINNLPVYVVGLANGSAMGGGFGLLSLCDMVIARKIAFFALSEVKLGVIPATISPYVVAKIGCSTARRLFMTGETIHVQKAVEIGLVQEVVDTADEMMKAAQKICEVMQSSAPQAVAAAKALVRTVQYKPITEELVDYTQAELVRVSCSKECEDGMLAVQQGKKAPWTQTPMDMPK